MIAKELLALIHPAINPKYSPNLHAWIKKQFGTSTAPIVMTKPDTTGMRRVGALREINWLSGANLNDVMCNGRKAKTWAIMLSHTGATLNIDDTFWHRYIRDGRCAIDPEHDVFFIGGETRWLAVPAKGRQPERRECQWCGHHVQVKLEWTETVHKSEWVAA